MVVLSNTKAVGVWLEFLLSIDASRGSISFMEKAKAVETPPDDAPVGQFPRSDLEYVLPRR
jgi:hypothetical protein